MDILGIVLAVPAGLICLIWLSRHLLISRAKRANDVLSAASAGPPSPAPKVSVVVAAKDEQDNIAACVETMLRQDYPSFDVTVVNDRSGDDTAAIVERIAAADPRVRLLNIDRLPEGWCGKNHAMWRGIAQTDGEYLCMIDADCRQVSDRTLSVAVQRATDEKTDLLSVLPTLEMKGFWENVVQPVCGGIMMIWFQPEKVNAPHRPEAYANGAFMLMRREVYHAIGTHEAVRDQVNEDLRMAEAVKRSGRRLRVIQNEGLYVVRMYSSLRQILNGWTRIFYGTFGTMRRMTVGLVVLAVMGLLPYAAALAGWLGWAMAGSAALLAAGVVGSAAVVMQISVMARFYGLIKAKPALCWTYSLGCVMGIVSLIRAMGKLRTGSAIVWRNTSYTRPTAGR